MFPFDLIRARAELRRWALLDDVAQCAAIGLHACSEVERLLKILQEAGISLDEKEPHR